LGASRSHCWSQPTAPRQFHHGKPIEFDYVDEETGKVIHEIAPGLDCDLGPRAGVLIPRRDGHYDWARDGGAASVNGR
jgi:hypothetical protein